MRRRAGSIWRSAGQFVMRRRLIASERGQALIELAFVLPVMLVFLLVLVVFGLALDHREVIQHAAREGARYGAVHPGVNGVIDETVKQSQDVLTPSDVSVCYEDGPDGQTAGDVGSYIRVSIDYTYGFTAGSGELLTAFGLGTPSISMTPIAEEVLEQPASGVTVCP
jgi:hypothetical protein